MELKLLLSNTSKLLSTKIVQFILGLVKAKLNAVLLGTTGVGIVNQITTTNQQFKQFTLLGIPDGLVKQISSRKDEADFRYKLISSLKSYFILILISSGISFSLLFFFSEELAVYLFGDIKYINYYYISVFSLSILIVDSISYSLLRSFKQIPLIARGELFATIFSFFAFVPLIYFYNLFGAVIALIIAMLLKLFLNYFYARRVILKKFSIKYKDLISDVKVNNDDTKELATFAGLGLFVGTYRLFTIISSRALIVSTLGISSLGLYAPVKTWGGFFTGLVLPTLLTYLYPRFSEAKSNVEINGILNDVFRLITFAVVPFLFGGIAFGKITIPFFYSSDFIDSYDYLPGHFLGILFTMWMVSFGMVFTPTGRIKIYVFFQVIMFTINLLLVYLLLPYIGLYAWMLYFLVTPIIFFLVYFFYLNRVINFKFETHNLKLMIFVLLSGLSIYFISKYYTLFGCLSGLFFILITIFFLKKNEKTYLVSKFHKITYLKIFKRK